MTTVASEEPTLEHVLKMAQRLQPQDQARLVARLAPILEQLAEQGEVAPPVKKRVPLRGILADLGPAPSAEEIDEVRSDMWAGFGQGGA